MKKAKLEVEEMRAEYRREDLGPLVRGKYAAAYAKATNVVVIDPGLTKVFPNSEAVNPDGHPNSPTFGHLKFPHPEAVRWRVKSGCFTASVGARQDVTFTPL
nr:hypothetical protein [Rhodoferax sp.]